MRHQAARVAYAKQQEDAEAGVNSVPHMPHGTDPHREDPPLIQLREALLAQSAGRGLCQGGLGA